MSEIVRLTQAEYFFSAQVGFTRCFEDHKRGFNGAVEGKIWNESDRRWDNCIVGAQAELAVCKYLKVHWSHSVNAQGECDIPPDIEVRSSNHPRAQLLFIRPGVDKKNRRYIFVTVNLLEFKIHGWISGEEAMVRKYYGKLKPLAPETFMVPITSLHSMRGFNVWDEGSDRHQQVFEKEQGKPVGFMA